MTEYPDRNGPVKSKRHYYEECDCGHTALYHDSPGMLMWIAHLFRWNAARGECERCMCPKFRRVKKE